MFQTEQVAEMLDLIANDDNVRDAIVAALVPVCHATYQNIDADCPPGYEGLSIHLNGSRMLTKALHATDWERTVNIGQVVFSHDTRYPIPVKIVMSNGDKVPSGFKVAAKGPMSVQYTGQLAFDFDGFLAEVAEYLHLWIFVDVIKSSIPAVAIYLVRVIGVASSNTVMLATDNDYRVLYKGPLSGPASPAAPTDPNLPQAPVISVVIDEVPPPV